MHACVCVCVAKPVAVELRCHATALIRFIQSKGDNWDILRCKDICILSVLTS